MTQAAGAKLRLFAFGLDYLLILCYIALLFGLSFLLPYPRDAAPGQAQLLGFLSLTLPVVLYFALSEAFVGATLGKRWVSLKVATISDEPLGLARSLMRSGIKFLPWELSHTALYRIVQPDPSLFWFSLSYLALAVAGLYLLGLLRPPHRPLYDRLSGTTVYCLTASEETL